MNRVIFVITLIYIAQSTINGKFPDAIRCGADGADGADGAIYFIHNFQASGDLKTLHYHQIHTPELRYVNFNADGGYKQGGGHYGSRKGCQSKSLQTLDKQNRTIYYALDSSMHKNQTKIDEENALKNRIAKLEEREAIKDKKMEENNAAIKNIITKLGEEVAAMKSKIAKMEQQQAINDKKIERLQNKNSELKKKLLSFSSNFWDYEQIKEKWVKEFKREMLTDIKEKGLQIGSRWKVQQEGAAFVIRDLQGSKVKDSRISFAQDAFSNPK